MSVKDLVPVNPEEAAPRQQDYKATEVKMKIKTKLLIGFMTILIPAMLIILFGAFTTSKNSAKSQQIAEKGMPDTLAFIELEKDVILILSWSQNISLTKAAEGYDQGFEMAEKHYNSALRTIDSLIARFSDSPEKMKEMEQLKTNLKNYYDVGKEVANTYINVGPEAGNAMLEAFNIVRNNLNEILNKYRNSQVENLVTTVTNIKNELILQKNISIVSIIIFVIFGILIALFLADMLVKPIKRMNESLYDISEGEGDLTTQLFVNSNDELGEMAFSFNKFIDKLRKVIKEVKDSSDYLGGAAEEINNAAQNISNGASGQAANVEEITSSLEEIGATIAQNTQNAKNTDSIASNSAKQAEEGGESVTLTVQSMRKIAERIGLIEDIAYKTNLLALNAAIEAARAGEHGKGFAVVAGEVRKLAEKSQIASQEISQLTQTSLEVSEKSGVILNEMVPKIKQTAELVQSIAVASEQQNLGVKQISEGMEQLNEITQQNAASSEELASTSSVLKTSALKLQKTMGFFKVD